MTYEELKRLEQTASPDQLPGIQGSLAMLQNQQQTAPPVLTSAPANQFLNQSYQELITKAQENFAKTPDPFNVGLPQEELQRFISSSNDPLAAAIRTKQFGQSAALTAAQNAGQGGLTEGGLQAREQQAGRDVAIQFEKAQKELGKTQENRRRATEVMAGNSGALFTSMGASGDQFGALSDEFSKQMSDLNEKKDAAIIKAREAVRTQNVTLMQDAKNDLAAAEKDTNAATQKAKDQIATIKNEKLTQEKAVLEQQNKVRDDRRTMFNNLVTQFGGEALSSLPPDSLKRIIDTGEINPSDIVSLGLSLKEKTTKAQAEAAKEKALSAEEKRAFDEQLKLSNLAINQARLEIAQDKENRLDNTLGGQLNTLEYDQVKNLLDNSRGSDGYVNTEVYKRQRAAVKKGDEFDKNFSYMLNPEDPSAQAFIKSNRQL